jgi:hypothetical protein
VRKVHNKLTTVVISKKDLSGINVTLTSFSYLNKNFPKLILVLSEYSVKEVEGLRTKYKYLNPDIYSIKSNGPYSAMNFGLEKTKTSFVNFLHGGDSYTEESAILDLLECMGNNTIGYGEIEIIKSTNTLLKHYSFKKYNVLLHRLGLKYIPHPATIVSTKAAKSVGGFDLNYSVAADQKMLLQLTKDNPPIILSQVIATFKLGGISTRSTEKIVNDFKKISFEIYGYFLKNKILDSILWNCNKYFRFVYNFGLNVKNNFL